MDESPPSSPEDLQVAAMFYCFGPKGDLSFLLPVSPLTRRSRREGRQLVAVPTQQTGFVSDVRPDSSSPRPRSVSAEEDTIRRTNHQSSPSKRCSITCHRGNQGGGGLRVPPGGETLRRAGDDWVRCAVTPSRAVGPHLFSGGPRSCSGNA